MSRIVAADDLAAVAGDQGLQELGRDRLLEEPDRAVGEPEVRAAGVMAEEAPGRDSAATSQSSGLVQVTAASSPASTTRIVFEVPSVISWILTPSAPGKIVAGPRGVR